MTPYDAYTKLYESHCTAALNMCHVSSDLYFSISCPCFVQTVALKLKNTDLTNYTHCLPLVQGTAKALNVKLFQHKKVREFLWGYEDALLYTITSFKTGVCPSSAAKGATPFVQIQVR